MISVHFPLLLSSLALIFTIYSFWWMNWRKGKLLVGGPRNYAACASDRNLLISIPLTFFNTGPTPIIVENLRLLVEDGNVEVRPLFFNATTESIGSSQGRKFATQFLVSGNSAIELICEFQRTPTDFKFAFPGHSMKVQAIINQRNNWKSIKTFFLNVEEKSVSTLNSNTFIVHDNWKTGQI